MAVSGLLLFIWSYQQHFCGGIRAFNHSKTFLISKSDSLITELGFSAPKGLARISAYCNSDLSDQLFRSLDNKGNHKFSQSQIPTFLWEISYEQKTGSQIGMYGKNASSPKYSQGQSFKTLLDSDGHLHRLFVFGQAIRKAQNQNRKLTDDKRLIEIARHFLHRFTSFSPAESPQPQILPNKQRPLMSKMVIFEQTLSPKHIKKRFAVEMLDEQIIGYDEYLIFNGRQLSYTPKTNPIHPIKYLLTISLLIIILWVFYRHIRQGHADFTRAFWLAFSVGILLASSEIINLLMKGTLAKPEPTRLLLAIIIGIALALIYLATEPIVRSVIPGRLASLDLLLSGILFDKRVGKSILNGYTAAAFILGLAAMPLLLAEQFHLAVFLHVHDFGKMITVSPPFMAAVRALLWRVPLLAMVFFFFIPSVLTSQKLSKNAVILLSGILFSFALYPLINFHPSWVEILFAALSGMILSALFLKDGVLAVNFAIGVVAIVPYMLPLLHSAPSEFFLSGIGMAAILCAPIIIAILSFFWPQTRGKIQTYMPTYLQRISEQASTERELQIAADIQNFLQPQKPASIGPIHFDFLFVPSTQVGGDALDFVPLEKNKFLIAVLDVSGHGVAAALLASHIQAQLRVLARYIRQPDKILKELNNYLYRTTPRYMFATMFLYIGDDHGKFTYSSAGQNPALHLHPDLSIAQLPPTGPALGLSPASRYTHSNGMLLPEDALLIYTDGISEAMNPENEEFGEDKLQLLFQSTTPLDHFLQILQQNVMNFTQGSIADDMTAFYIRNSPFT